MLFLDERGHLFSGVRAFDGLNEAFVLRSKQPAAFIEQPEIAIAIRVYVQDFSTRPFAAQVHAAEVAVVKPRQIPGLMADPQAACRILKQTCHPAAGQLRSVPRIENHESRAVKPRQPVISSKPK